MIIFVWDRYKVELLYQFQGSSYVFQLRNLIEEYCLDAEATFTLHPKPGFL